MSALTQISPRDLAGIDAAIKNAESRTDAKFSLVVVPVSERYALYPIVVGAVLALIAGAVCALAWPDVPLRRVVLAQGMIFILVAIVFDWRPLRLLLVPRKVQHAEARELARSEFVARTLSDPDHRIDVLFFVSLGERYVEIIAEQELHGRVGETAWQEIVKKFVAAAGAGRVADGVVEAVNACGVLLETHRPKS